MTQWVQVRAYFNVLTQLEQVHTLASDLETKLPVGLKLFASQGHITLDWRKQRMVQIPMQLEMASQPHPDLIHTPIQFVWC